MNAFALSRRSFGIAACSLFALTALGCGPTWIVVKQQNPNPMMGAKEFLLAPVSYVGLKVGTLSEAEYLASKDQESQQSFLGDKAEAAKNLSDVLIAKAAQGGVSVRPAAETPGSFVLRPNITFVEPGTFTGFVNIATTVEMRLEIVDAQQQVVDEVIFKADIQPSLSNPSSGGRMHSAGKNLGDQTAQYILARAGR